MNGALVQRQSWPGRRWWAVVACVFSIQLGLILWLGDHHPAPPRAAAAAPTLKLAGAASADLLALIDPTLFALPHRQGFSGRAWLTITAQEFHPFVWSEPPRWLELADDQLGVAFHAFLATNQFPELPVLSQPELELKLPQVSAPDNFPARSSLRLFGELASRRLLTPMALPAWPNAEILTNSLVQVLVAADGHPVSATLLLSKGSGSREADLYALRLARDARFEPVIGNQPGKNPLAGLAWGQLVFEWQTLPLPPTNSVVEPPPAK